MPKLPGVTATEAIKALEKLGSDGLATGIMSNYITGV